ncbi:MAG: DegV family protein [Anaerolineae bacterium]|nr:DegV family protein [Anaerolineae bacterium]
MRKYKTALITDSACDIPQELLIRYKIDVVPLYVIWGSEQLRDRVDIQPVDFYNRLQTDPVHPSTSQPNPDDFVRAFEKARANGAKDALLLTISGAMSSTYDSAQLALEATDFPVTIVDTLANSMSQGWQVLAAARARENGGDLQAMVDAAEKVRKNVVTLLYVDTLEYLYRGGRIGRAARWLGAMLDLKPQLYVDHTTGKIEPGERHRTQKVALEKMYQRFFSLVDTSKPLRVAILHGNVPDRVVQISERIMQEYAPVEMFSELTSPVMGVHTGPGALALCGYAVD